MSDIGDIIITKNKYGYGSHLFYFDNKEKLINAKYALDVVKEPYNLKVFSVHSNFLIVIWNSKKNMNHYEIYKYLFLRYLYIVLFFDWYFLLFQFFFCFSFLFCCIFLLCCLLL